MGKIAQSRRTYLCVRERECGRIEIMEVNMKAGICSTAEIIRYEQHTLIDGCARVTLLLYIMRSA